MITPLVHFSTVFMAFFAIMNPVANAPVFVGLTEGLDEATRRGVAIRAVLIAFAIVAAFSILGREIFHAFGITLPAFRIAGGILIAMVGYQMLEGQASTVQVPTEADNERSREAAISIALSPLAMPILAGPGSIATAMSFTAESSVAELSRILSALAIICLVNLAAFRTSGALVRFLGPNGIKVVSRLMGLLLAVIGTQMLITGIRGAVAAS